MLETKASGCSVYIALLHHSMRDKNGAVVTTAVTNLDIHDIARSARTFGAKRYFIVNPLEEQQAVVKRIIGHWQGRGGREYNPDRSEAFSQTQIVSWYQDVIAAIEKEEGVKPEVWMTTAKCPAGMRSMSWAKARERLSGGKPKLVAFGTGWGMTDELLSSGDWILDPINPAEDSGYNHLSVRSAVAIALDRLLGKKDF